MIHLRIRNSIQLRYLIINITISFFKLNDHFTQQTYLQFIFMILNNCFQQHFLFLFNFTIKYFNSQPIQFINFRY